MTSKSINTTIIPAEPGWRVLYASEVELCLCEAFILAWRIETHEHGDTNASYPFAIELNGDVCDNCWGYQRPDGKVEALVSGEVYASFAAAQEAFAAEQEAYRQRYAKRA